MITDSEHCGRPDLYNDMQTDILKHMINFKNIQHATSVSQTSFNALTLEVDSQVIRPVTSAATSKSSLFGTNPNLV